MPLNKFAIVHDEDSTDDLLVTQSGTGWARQVAPGSTVEFARSGEFQLRFVERSSENASVDVVPGEVGVDDLVAMESEQARQVSVQAAVDARAEQIKAQQQSEDIEKQAQAKVAAEAAEAQSTTASRRGGKKQADDISGDDK